MLSAASQRKLAHDLGVCVCVCVCVCVSVSVWEEGERMEICYQGRKIYLDTQTHAHMHTYTQWACGNTLEHQRPRMHSTFLLLAECKSESESQREAEQCL